MKIRTQEQFNKAAPSADTESEMNKVSQPLPYSVIYGNKGRQEPEFKIRDTPTEKQWCPRYADWEAVVSVVRRLRGSGVRGTPTERQWCPRYADWKALPTLQYREHIKDIILM
jgi:hypothetical protein